MATDLNPQYEVPERWRAVVDHGTGYLIVNAGPGTGKTYSLLRRIQTLLDRGVKTEAIVYLTFVNSIIDAFKKDVTKPVAEHGLGFDPAVCGLNILTLHSLALKIVKTYASKLSLPEHLEAIDASPTTESVNSRLALDDLFLLAKSEGINSRDAFNSDLDSIRRVWQSNTTVPENLQYLEQGFDTLLRSYHILPWDRLVPLAITAIIQNGLPRWVQGFKHFLVDEYQDFNPAEQRFLELVCEPSDAVVIVGDVDQSIYSGRSASPTGLEALLRRDDVAVVNFVRCWRCPPAVVDGANRILALMDPDHWEARRLVAVKPGPGTLRVETLKSCKAELDVLAARIREREGLGLDRIVVLLPGTRGLEYYRSQLEARGIRCSIGRGDSAEEHLRGLLRLVLLRTHPFLERTLLGSAPAGPYPRLASRFRSHGLGPFVSESTSLANVLSACARAKPARRDIAADLERYQAHLTELVSNDAPRVCRTLATCGYSIGEEAIRSFLTAPDTDTVGERVEFLLRGLRSATATVETPSVAVMTIHSSKGLSKSAVMLVAFEDRFIPGTAVGEQLTEKHRLCYVALTRSEAEVFITAPATRAKGDPLNFQIPNTRSGLSRYGGVCTRASAH